MTSLILVEHNNETLSSATLHVLDAALKLNKKITMLVVGYECEKVSITAASLKGVDKVLYVDEPCFKNFLAEDLATLVAEIGKDYDYILAASSTQGKNILPRVASLLNNVQVSDVLEIIDDKTFLHPIYAGNALETVEVLDAIKILTIRTTAFNAINEKQNPVMIEKISKTIENVQSEFISCKIVPTSRPDLSNASIIVSGGRGLKSRENFKLIEELADTLHAAIGASRAAVDAGFVSNDFQVGQTGKIVAPRLYIAIGISGAIQHLAGMKDAKIIVAINKDADAPIFQVADYGLKGDLFEIVPKLIEALKQNH